MRRCASPSFVVFSAWDGDSVLLAVELGIEARVLKPKEQFSAQLSALDEVHPGRGDAMPLVKAVCGHGAPFGAPVSA